MSTVAESNDRAAGESTEVHAVGGWALVVRADGAVGARTHWDNGDPKVFTTAPDREAPDASATYRYGKTIEGVLARYTHETRFDRDLNDRENGAAFRRGIIEALCELAPTEFLGDSERRPVGVVHVNAPTGPSTHIVSENGSDVGTYATFHPFENVGGQ